MPYEESYTTQIQTEQEQPSYSGSLFCTVLLLVIPLVLILISRPSRPVPLWSPSKLPDPRFDATGICKRGGPSFICDPDGLLLPSYADAIDEIIAKVQEGFDTTSIVTCANGGTRALRIELALMREMDHAVCSGCRQGRTDDYQIAMQLAEELYGDWRVSDPDCENGLLILLALRDRQLRMVAGDAAWRMITEEKANAILETAGALIGRRDRLHPNIRSIRVSQALLDAVQNLTHIDDHLPLGDTTTSVDKTASTINVAFIFLFAFIGLLAAFNLSTIRANAFQAGQATYRAAMDLENERIRIIQNPGAPR